MVKSINNRQVGDDVERRVCLLLEKHGYKIITRNFRVRQGEIDIVALDGNYLSFVEVKYRGTSQSGFAVEAVNQKKQVQISKTALFFISQHPNYQYYNMRFDVVAVDGDRAKIYKNAFPYCYRT